MSAESVAHDQGRVTECFNRDWRFARFGAMPDGSRAEEPGGPASVFRITASSEESGKGNFAENVVDGDTAEPHCARLCRDCFGPRRYPSDP